MKHSELPWDILPSKMDNGMPCRDLVAVLDGVYRFLGEIPDDDNAAFIVKACNNHYKLLEALEKIRDLKSDDRYAPLEIWEFRDIAEKAIKEVTE